MRVPVEWLREHVDVPADASGEDVAAALVRVGLEEEALHGGDVAGPLVVGRVLAFVEEPQKNGRTIRWCSVDVGKDGPGAAADGPAERGRGIVCGARNFSEGDLVVVVLPGAVLPGGFAIASRRTYGHVSDGMICSAAELGVGGDDGGIVVLSEWGLDASPGDDAVALLGIGEPTVEVNVTPDRGYALSVRGVAREYAHGARLAVADHYRDPVTATEPPASDAGPGGHPVSLAEDDGIEGVPGCDRFVARVVRGVDPQAQTPWWVRRRLVAAGMRPISLAVDVTNYVMLLLGQPLHAYDLAALDGEITVRRAAAGERLTTLDGVDRALHAQDLLITDGDAGRRVIGLAGVMGGRSTEVGPDTRDVLVEAAHFDPVSVARTARRHKLPSEASRRFERGVDPLLGPAAADLVARLLAEHGGGRPDEAVTDVGRPALPVPVELDPELPTRLTGVALPQARVVELLCEVGCTPDGSVGPGDDTRAAGAVLLVRPPSWRPDLVQAADLVEEVARLAGYDEIPSVLPAAPPGRGLDPARRQRATVGRALAEAGLVEVLSYPFVAPGRHDEMGLDADDPRRLAARLANPLSDEQPELRTSVLATLVDVLRRNVSRGATDVGLFEVGRVTRPVPGAAPAGRPGVARRPGDDELAALDAAVPPQPWRVAAVLSGPRDPRGWWGAGRAVEATDAVELGRVVAAACGVELGVAADDHAPWHPGRCAVLTLGAAGDAVVAGHAGELHPRAVEALGLPPRTCALELELDVLLAASPGPVRARPVVTFPVATQDVALVVPDAVPAGEVLATLREGAGDLLEGVRLFDVWTGDPVPAGHRSLAFALRLRAPDRTLTSAEATAARDAAVALAGRRHDAAVRGEDGDPRG